MCSSDLKTPMFKNQKERDFSALFFFSPQNHQCRGFGILNFLNFCFSQLRVSSHDFEFKSQYIIHIKEDFGIKYFFSESNSFGMTRLQSVVALIWKSMVMNREGQRGRYLGIQGQNISPL